MAQSKMRMALILQPPSPPPAPLSYSPPCRDDRVDFQRQVEDPLETALGNLALLFQDLQESPNESLRYYYTSRFIEIIGYESFNILHPILYPSSCFEDNLLQLLHGIRTEIKEAPHQAAPTEPPPPAVIDVTPVVTAMNEKIDEFRKETASSLKSFADAVKVSAPTPPLPAASPPKPKFSPPAIKGNQLPQAVIRYRGRVDTRSRPSFVDLVPRLNHSLHNHPKFSHVRVAGVKWTAASNLLIRAQAPSPSVLVAALEAIRPTLTIPHLTINDIIPNTRWSHVTLSHVHTGKTPNSPAHSPEELHEELALHNPAYASLTIRQPPSWVRDPKTLRDGQTSSVSFAFEDPDGTRARQLTGTPLTAFGNLRCLVKAWVTPKKHPQVAGTPLPPKVDPQDVRPPTSPPL